AGVRTTTVPTGEKKKAEKAMGNPTKVRVVKNNLAPPFREIEFDIMYGEGISREGDILDLASESNVLEKSGAWFAWKGERIGQGRENAKEFLKTHPEIANEIERAVLEKHGIARKERNAPTTAAIDVESAPHAAAPATAASQTSAAGSTSAANPAAKKRPETTPRA